MGFADIYYSIFGTRIADMSGRMRRAFVLSAAALRGRAPVVTGGCRQCGECCSRVNLRHGKTWIRSEKQFRAIQRTVPDYAHFEITGRTSSGELNFRCTRLGEDNLCTIYETRPAFCRDYPSPDLLLIGGALPSNCGYGIKIAKPFTDFMKDASLDTSEKQFTEDGEQQDG